jgi:hypothetical protein
VLESKPRDSLSAGSLKESCTMIVGRRARPATEITYQLRRDGIFSVQAGTEGPQAAAHPNAAVGPARADRRRVVVDARWELVDVKGL